MSKAVLGVDIGGVIIDRINDNTDTSFFGDNYLKTTEVPAAFMVLWYLSGGQKFKGHIHLVSKALEHTAERTREWLAHHDFYEFTGIPPEHVHFCRTRPEKAAICKRLGITHFVDDRAEVIYHLSGIVENRFLFRPTENDLAEWRGAPEVSQVPVFEEWTRLGLALAL